ncbi:MAG: putative redox protein, regulator of disulfide bond formation [Firmicutes bacterium]|nr:putative redox protein, regulator of disulfide bond formation [Bacillota bacterium]
MIDIISRGGDYQCCFAAKENIVIDTTQDKGGTGVGVRPHQLLEAALAACMNIALRMKAKEYGIELKKVTTSVSLNRDIAGKSIFEYQYNICDELPENVKNIITDIVKHCAVRKTLSKQIEFKEIQ